MNKDGIVAQLGSISKMMQTLDGVDLYINVLDVCGGLVNILSSQITYTEVDSEGVKDIISCMGYIGKGLESISKTVGQAECLKVSTEAIENLAKAVSNKKELTEKEQNASEQLKDIEKNIKVLEPIVDDLEKKYRFKSEFKASLEKNLEQFSEDKIKKLKDENTTLTGELAQKQAEHQKLVDEKKKYQKKIKDIENKILALPQEAELVRAYDEKEAEYKRLLNAREDCSEEKQLEILEKIGEIEHDTNELTEAMKILKNRKEEIDKAKTKVETKKGVFETDFIEKIEKAMDDLKNHMRTHRNALNRVKEKALELKQHIGECDEIYKNYTFMFETDKTPLEAIAKASKTEYEQLAKHFDINKSEYVQNLRQNIERDLSNLEKVISECTKATATDQQSIITKAFIKERK